MLKTKTRVVAASLFSLFVAGIAPAAAQSVPVQRTLFCGGNNFLRLAGTEAVTTAYFLRNYHPTGSVTIDRVLVFNALGVIIYNSTVSGIPASFNGLIGPANNVMAPHQTANIISDSFLPYLASTTDRPIQVQITYTGSGGAALEATYIDRARVRNTVTGNQEAERSRAMMACRS